MHVHFVMHRIVTELIGLAVRDARLDARSSESNGETAGIVVSTVLPLRIRRCPVSIQTKSRWEWSVIGICFRFTTQLIQ